MSRCDRLFPRPVPGLRQTVNSIVHEGIIGYYKVDAIPMYRIGSECPVVPEEMRSGTADGYSTGARARASRAITPIRGCLV